MTITADQFIAAFRDRWIALITEQPDLVEQFYSNNRYWTGMMLGEAGLLASVCKALVPTSDPTLSFRSQWYTLDALFVSGKDLFRTHLTYPDRLDVLIEHEHGDDWEEEMWKLIFWRSPLKVIIGYDYNEQDRTTEKKQQWLSKKLQTLREMLNSANAYHPECETTQYLLIVGSREHRASAQMQWRWCRIDRDDSALVAIS